MVDANHIRFDAPRPGYYVENAFFDATPTPTPTSTPADTPTPTPTWTPTHTATPTPTVRYPLYLPLVVRRD